MSVKRETCPDCGADLRDKTKFGNYTYKRFACGKVCDDGPGSPCPNAPKNEDPIVNVSYEMEDGALTSKTIRSSEVEEFLNTNDWRRKRVAVIDPNAGPEASTEVAEAFPVVLVDGVLQEVKNIPELSKLDRLEAVLTHIEGFANMVVTKDDKKGADLADERRKVAKRIRVAVSKICKDEREEAVEELKRLQSFWIATDRRIETRLKAVEEHLAAQVKVYTDEKERIAQAAAAEKARKEAERAAEAKRVLQARIQRLVDLGATPNVAEIATATDEEFEGIVSAAAEAQATRLAQQEAERIERERLAAEQRARTERIEARAKEASRAGILAWWANLDALADLTDEEFCAELAERIEAKALADQEAERIRAEAEAAEAERLRVQAEEKARLDAERAELEAERQRLAAQREQQEASERAAEDERCRQREAAEAQRIAEEQRLADEAAAALLEAQRPDRERILQWLDAIESDLTLGLDPRIQDDALRARWRDSSGVILSAIQIVKLDFAE